MLPMLVVDAPPMRNLVQDTPMMGIMMRMVCFCSVQPTIKLGANAMVSMLRSIGDLYCEIEDLQDLVMKSPSWPVTFMHAINMPRSSLPGESGTSNTILIL